MTHKLYVMRTTGFVKVGVTSQPIEKRVRAVQTGTPTPIFYVSYFIVNSRERAFAIEKAIHKKLQRRRTYGEWFSNVRENSKELHEVLSEYSINKSDEITLSITDGKFIPDEISRAYDNIVKYTKNKERYKLAGLGSKIYSLDTVKRVKELEQKYQSSILELSLGVTND